MIQIQGKYTSAKVFTYNIEETAMKQVLELCNQDTFKDANVRIMSDCHAGKGCVIGFTSTFNNRIIPNLIGVDIGCGVIGYNLGNIDIDLEEFDRKVRQLIPLNTNVRTKVHTVISKFFPDEYLNKMIDICNKVDCDYERALLSIGSLGGGNHFIELNKSKTGDIWLMIHSGSRNFGQRVATYHQNKAINYCNGTGIPKELSYLEGEDAQEYLHDMKHAQFYAVENRIVMVTEILSMLGKTFSSFKTISSTHNYIDNNNIIRKGAISAHLGDYVIIPLNMRDGVILGAGLGNPDWNFSAPHGAGRTMSRSKAKRELTLEAFQDSMDGIYTTSVNESTLDEACFAYKPAQEIIDSLGDTVRIIEVLKPIYNLKG